MYTIGIDEVGRGPLAGPVVVAALAIAAAAQRRVLRVKNLPPLRDSKKLSASQREGWFLWLKKQPDVFCALSRVYPQTIDRLNISGAANLAAKRAFQKVGVNLNAVTSARRAPVGQIRVLLDGGLFVSPKKLRSKILTVGRLNFQPTTIIGGDEKCVSIKLASIVAKVARDRLMQDWHRRFSQYGFDVHKGYGTRAHIAALKKYGPCRIHRRSFLSHFVWGGPLRFF